MTTAKIYRPAKNAMQSGPRLAARWVLEYIPERALSTEPLMGWTSAPDTLRQVRLSFESEEAAIAFAQEKGVAYELLPPKKRRIIPKNYSANFAATRRIPLAFSNKNQRINTPEGAKN